MDISQFLFALFLAVLWFVGVTNAIVGIRKRKLNLMFSTFSGKWAIGMGIFALVFLLVFLPQILLFPLISLLVEFFVRP